MLDQKSLSLLERLYDSPEGLPPDFSPIDTTTYLNLIRIGMIEEPGMKLIHTGPGERMVIHGNLAHITPYGRAAVEEARALRHKAAIEEARQNQQRAEEETREAQRRKERLEDHAREERYHIEQNKTTIKAAVISALISLPAGMLIEHFSGIVSFISSLFP